MAHANLTQTDSNQLLEQANAYLAGKDYEGYGSLCRATSDPSVVFSLISKAAESGDPRFWSVVTDAIPAYMIWENIELASAYCMFAIRSGKVEMWEAFHASAPAGSFRWNFAIFLHAGLCNAPPLWKAIIRNAPTSFWTNPHELEHFLNAPTPNQDLKTMVEAQIALWAKRD